MNESSKGSLKGYPCVSETLNLKQAPWAPLLSSGLSVLLLCVLSVNSFRKANGERKSNKFIKNNNKFRIDHLESTVPIRHSGESAY